VEKFLTRYALSKGKDEIIGVKFAGVCALCECIGERGGMWRNQVGGVKVTYHWRGSVKANL
jgi:hypothetical protein